jgi:hypothetical protein
MSSWLCWVIRDPCHWGLRSSLRGLDVPRCDGARLAPAWLFSRGREGDDGALRRASRMIGLRGYSWGMPCDVEQAGVIGTQVQDGSRPLDRTDREHRLAGLGNGYIHRPSSSERAVQGWREFDCRVIGNLELHGDHGWDAPANECVRHSGERVGRVCPSRFARVEYC